MCQIGGVVEGQSGWRDVEALMKGAIFMRRGAQGFGVGNLGVRGVVAVAATLCLTVVGLTMSADTRAGATIPYTTQSNLCYEPMHGSCVGGASHEFDAYLPSGLSGKTPAVILIHGGGHVSGDKSGFAPTARQLAGAGMAAFSINYTLATPSTPGYPTQINEVMTAVSYLRAHAGTFHVDGNRMALFGASAGADLALVSGLKAQQTDPAARVQALVGWSGGYDYTVGSSGTIDPTQLANAETYLGCSDPTDPTCQAKAVGASAVSWIQANDPPVLVASSTDYQLTCEIVNPAQSEELQTDLQAAGDSVTLDLNSECAHATAYSNVEFSNTLVFLKSHLFVAPVITSKASARFVAGQPKTVTIKTRANPTAVISKSGTLPAGVTFVANVNGTATISGTASVADRGKSFPITITAANGGSPNAVQSFVLSVA